jgi:hypothetical protein
MRSALMLVLVFVGLAMTNRDIGDSGRMSFDCPELSLDVDCTRNPGSTHLSLKRAVSEISGFEIRAVLEATQRRNDRWMSSTL